MLGALASVLGGVGVYVAGFAGDNLAAAAGFASWHVAMCLAIHFGGEPSAFGGRIAKLFTRKSSPRTATSIFLAVGHGAR